MVFIVSALLKVHMAMKKDTNPDEQWNSYLNKVSLLVFVDHYIIISTKLFP